VAFKTEIDKMVLLDPNKTTHIKIKEDPRFQERKASSTVYQLGLELRVETLGHHQQILNAQILARNVNHGSERDSVGRSAGTGDMIVGRNLDVECFSLQDNITTSTRQV
jgi:hypothetical protein